MKVINEELLDIYRSKGRCENCGIPCQPEAHHLFTKGMGGAFRLDIHENIIALCMGCHRKFHNGTITRGTFIKVVAKRQSKTPAEIEETVLRMRHQEKPKMQLETAMYGLAYHPVANLFPRMTGPALDELEADIKAHGIHTPIVLWEGQLIEGRHRWEASNKLGVDCPRRDFEGTEEQAIHFALSSNLQRRHLSQNEKIIVAAESKKLYAEAALKREQAGKGVDDSGGRGNKKNPVANLPQGLGPENAGKTHEKLAELAGVSPRTMQAAFRVVEQADEEIVEAVKADEVSISDAASVANLPLEEQKEALAEVKAGKAKTLRKAVRKKKSKFDGAEKDPKPEKELTIEEQIKVTNGTIESFCRKIMKVAEECPDDEWLQDLNRRDAALQKFKDGCATLRSAKCTHACPVCNGNGCRQCRNTGRVPEVTYKMLV